MSRSVFFSRTAFLIALSLSVTGCFEKSDGIGARGRRAQTRTAGLLVEPLRPGSIPANAAIGQLNPDWIYSGYESLEHLFRYDFMITGSHRDAAAEQQVLNALVSRQLDLGVNNYAMGLSESLGPEPTKFRALVELTGAACNVAMRDPIVRQKFFPEVNSSDVLVNSASAYDVSFLRLLGRYPEAAEKSILVAMVNDLRVQGSALESQLLGVCTVILNSLEFMHGR
jgi:hypothetical protein